MFSNPCGAFICTGFYINAAEAVQEVPKRPKVTHNATMQSQLGNARTFQSLPKHKLHFAASPWMRSQLKVKANIDQIQPCSTSLHMKCSGGFTSLNPWNDSKTFGEGTKPLFKLFYVKKTDFILLSKKAPEFYLFATILLCYVALTCNCSVRLIILKCWNITFCLLFLKFISPEFQSVRTVVVIFLFGKREWHISILPVSKSSRVLRVCFSSFKIIKSFVTLCSLSIDLNFALQL